MARARIQAAPFEKFDPGPAHVARHVGPSEDARGTAHHGPYRTQDQIKNRGRWRAKTSVLRYPKSFILSAAEDALPKPLFSQGESLWYMLDEIAAADIANYTQLLEDIVKQRQQDALMATSVKADA